MADSPYRFVRNPLYLANVLVAIGLGMIMSRVGFVFCVIGIVIFWYRLIFREEGELQARVSSSGQRPEWRAGFKAESWYWSFAVAPGAFALTLDLKWFFLAMAGAVVSRWRHRLRSPAKYHRG